MTPLRKGKAHAKGAHGVEVRWHLPKGEILVWAGDRPVVAILVTNGGRDFLDARTLDLLPWPTHWMELPAPPNA